MWKTRSGGKWAASLGAGAVLPDGAQPGPQLCSQCEISYTGAAALVQQRQGARGWGWGPESEGVEDLPGGRVRASSSSGQPLGVQLWGGSFGYGGLS